jgi:hypothetical protein
MRELGCWSKAKFIFDAVALDKDWGGIMLVALKSVSRYLRVSRLNKSEVIKLLEDEGSIIMEDEFKIREFWFEDVFRNWAVDDDDVDAKVELRGITVFLKMSEFLSNTEPWSLVLLDGTANIHGFSIISTFGDEDGANVKAGVIDEFKALLTVEVWGKRTGSFLSTIVVPVVLPYICIFG